jgi:4-hydroxyphenylpyruvate dioxygenase
VVVNEMATSSASSAALGVVCPAVSDVADRAKALLWPAVATTRGQDEAPLPGISAPSGLHVFVSGEATGTSYWQGDFTPIGNDDDGFLLGIDHVGVTLSRDDLDDEVGFFRTVFDLAPGTVEEFIEPQGRLQSRALRPARGDLRIVLNVEETGPGPTHRSGVTQVAFGCDDVRAVVHGLRSRGVALMAVPDNYYVDLDARFGLATDLLEDLRAHHLLYDRIGDGELLHAYTDVLSTGFYVEVLERRGGYDAYGSASTHVRLAAQR